MIDCPDCNGAGERKCPSCKGKGHSILDGIGADELIPYVCSRCAGKKVKACVRCLGRGKIRTTPPD